MAKAPGGPGRTKEVGSGLRLSIVYQPPGPLGRYYADIRQTVPASDQEMNSVLAELSRVRPPLYTSRL